MANEGNVETQQALIPSNGDAYGSTASPADSVEDEGPPVAVVKSRTRPAWEIIAILSTAFAYGCILTTLFLITLPLECERIQRENPALPKSVSLGIFVAIAGITQLVSPLVGMLSDTYNPPTVDMGQRLPYLVLGAILTVMGLVGQIFASDRALWIRYSFAFFAHMIGLNVVYSMMITLIPDQVHESQTGTANGILALLLVTGSLFGFGLFHTVLSEVLQSMYGLYTCIVIITTILTCRYASDGDVALAQRRRQEHQLPPLAPSNRHLLRSPTLLLRTMLYDPLKNLDWKTLAKSYTIDTVEYHNFFVVTVSRTFYYMGISVQTFFLYYVHDIIGVHRNPEGAVAMLAIVGQCSGALTCVPVGWASDRFFGGQRKPFVYLACTILACAMLALLTCSTMTQVTIIGIILGAANGMYLTMDTSLAVDALPTDNGVDTSETAQLLGVWGVAGFVGSALGPLIGGPLLYAFGQQETTSDSVTDVEEYSLRGFAVIICLSAVYFCLSAFVLRFVDD